MFSKISKQLLSVVYSTVAITIEREPGIITVRGRPRESFGKAVAIKVESYATPTIAKLETVT